MIDRLVSIIKYYFFYLSGAVGVITERLQFKFITQSKFQTTVQFHIIFTSMILVESRNFQHKLNLAPNTLGGK